MVSYLLGCIDALHVLFGQVWALKRLLTVLSIAVQNLSLQVRTHRLHVTLPVKKVRGLWEAGHEGLCVYLTAEGYCCTHPGRIIHAVTVNILYEAQPKDRLSCKIQSHDSLISFPSSLSLSLPPLPQFRSSCEWFSRINECGETG